MAFHSNLLARDHKSCLDASRYSEAQSNRNFTTLTSQKDYASPLWDRAEECRAIAATKSVARLKSCYLKLADDYLDLAAKEEKLASLLKSENG